MMAEVTFNDDSKSIISTIQDSVRTEQIEVEPGDYTSRQVYRVPNLAFVDTLGVASLTGLVDYINNALDEQALDAPFIRVQSPTQVLFVNGVHDPEDRRFTPIMAEADTPTLVFDRFMPKEDFMIMLQSRFVETDEQEDLLMKLGNLVASEELGQEDDGVTQNLTLQKGFKRIEEKIENPVTLRPYRTFTEIDQPESPFIVRIKKDDRDGINIALFEADGGAWRNVARRSIKKYLEAEIEKDYAVIA